MLISDTQTCQGAIVNVRSQVHHQNKNWMLIVKTKWNVLNNESIDIKNAKFCTGEKCFVRIPLFFEQIDYGDGTESNEEVRKKRSDRQVHV